MAIAWIRPLLGFSIIAAQATVCCANPVAYDSYHDRPGIPSDPESAPDAFVFNDEIIQQLNKSMRDTLKNDKEHGFCIESGPTLRTTIETVGYEDRIGLWCPSNFGIVGDVHTHPKEGGPGPSGGDMKNLGRDTFSSFVAHPASDITTFQLITHKTLKLIGDKGNNLENVANSDITTTVISWAMASSFIDVIDPSFNLSMFQSSYYVTCQRTKMACYIRIGNGNVFVRLSRKFGEEKFNSSFTTLKSFGNYIGTFLDLTKAWLAGSDEPKLHLRSSSYFEIIKELESLPNLRADTSFINYRPRVGIIDQWGQIFQLTAGIARFSKSGTGVETLEGLHAVPSKTPFLCVRLGHNVKLTYKGMYGSEPLYDTISGTFEIQCVDRSVGANSSPAVIVENVSNHTITFGQISGENVSGSRNPIDQDDLCTLNPGLKSSCKSYSVPDWPRIISP